MQFLQEKKHWYGRFKITKNNIVFIKIVKKFGNWIKINKLQLSSQNLC